MAALWEPDFDVYVARLDDKPATFLVDLGAAAQVPVETHSLRLDVRMALQQPTDEGLRAQQEAEAMHNAHDAIIERLTAAFDAIFVGHVVSEGEVTMMLYAPAEAREHLQHLPEIVGDVEPYQPKFEAEDDPAWDAYSTFLYPDAYSFQFMMNRRVIAAGEEHGDRIEVPRTIDHWAYFDTVDQAQKAAAELRKAGFEVAEPEQRAEDQDEPTEPGNDELKSNGLGASAPPTWGLSFQREDHLSDHNMDEVCIQILDIITPLGGEYDGWGTPLVVPEGNA